jgi:hypothetical protein
VGLLKLSLCKSGGLDKGLQKGALVKLFLSFFDDLLASDWTFVAKKN